MKVKVAQSCLTLCNPMDYIDHGFTGVGSLSLLQGIFPTQESNWGFLHCRQILYQTSYQGEASNALIPKPQNTTGKENYR